ERAADRPAWRGPRAARGRRKGDVRQRAGAAATRCDRAAVARHDDPGERRGGDRRGRALPPRPERGRGGARGRDRPRGRDGERAVARPERTERGRRPGRIARPPGPRAERSPLLAAIYT